MAYELKAVIGHRDAVLQVGLALSLNSIQLTDELSLIPWRPEDFDALGPSDDDLDLPGFWLSHHLLTAQLTRDSIAGDLLYVEAEFFGGTGEQGAALFRDGGLAWSLPVGPATAGRTSPISEGLSRIGVERSMGLDQFAVLDLGRHRSTGDWLPQSD